MPLLKVDSLGGRRRLVCCMCYSIYPPPSYLCLPPVAQVSSVYERCCVLFNIGVLQSQIAKSQNFDNDDGLKSAARHFQVWRPSLPPPPPLLHPLPPIYTGCCRIIPTAPRAGVCSLTDSTHSRPVCGGHYCSHATNVGSSTGKLLHQSCQR